MPLRGSQGISDPALEDSTKRVSYATFEHTSVELEQETPDSIRPHVPEIPDAALQWLVARLAWEQRIAALHDSRRARQAARRVDLTADVDPGGR